MLLKRCPRKAVGLEACTQEGLGCGGGGAVRQEGVSSVVGIPWEDTGSSPGPGRGGSCMPHGCHQGNPEMLISSISPDLRSCPDEYSSNTGFQEHSGQSSLSSVLDWGWIVCAGHLCSSR